ncbi:hypothetical protein OAQ43_02200 [Alphaproteobacteria bacterium]|nr:hypothetical protein [Alphaproteobacteria bacterium]
MDKVIVTTSINPPTEAIEKFDNFKDWTLLVIGDKKTPIGYKLKNGIYFSPKEQVKLDKKLSDLIGWNCIERRNFGLIYAKKIGAKTIALVDDDNIPYKFWGKNILLGKKQLMNEYIVKDGVFDPFMATEYNNLWHRGFPLELIDTRKIRKVSKKNIIPDVQADFWNGDPDIDAICRMMMHPSCKFKNNNFPFYSKKLSPFNTQNTFLSTKVLKNYFLFPDVGRMHDIWAAYYLQYKENVNVVYNKASVIQKRNNHNLITDLKNEFIGLKKNFLFTKSMINKNFNLNDFFTKKAIMAFKQYQTHFKNES